MAQCLYAIMPEQYHYCAAVSAPIRRPPFLWPAMAGGRKVYSLIDIMRYVLVVLYCGRSSASSVRPFVGGGGCDGCRLQYSVDWMDQCWDVCFVY